ncbi:Dihydroxyacetone kinase 2 [Coemansia sp. RSA 2049]|nr:Dihydroxyacetone kinase 2 [Coemansia sp. RSA 1939]KAJ2523167.1 Dihydroxyacetone kinase 2 [Coemansia sp. RSA 2049]KAJ2615540.1 Dihydroxyacetone kinase 2 [Coemansia sp. RSA 1804]KAJ2684303.1 Dihydroxyacetone kinase 2 [Coemansia sp. RSA 1285]
MTGGKHFVTDPKTLVRDSLHGLTLANPHLSFDEQQKVIFVKDLADLRKKQATLFCGGGSGHEPAHAGFVGHGMLTSAVSGHVFASPTSSQVLSCLRRVYSEEHGTLVVIKNYTGDVLNFGRAVERFKSERVNHGKPLPKVATVVVDDDVGVVNPNDDDEGGVGRRGLAGTVLVYKAAGACAAGGGSLEQVKANAEYVISHTFTIGCALNAASVPGTGLPRSLQDNEVEIGMGIHNEPGFETKELQPANVLIPSLVDHIVNSAQFKSVCSGTGRVLLMVNNLGATSNLEMGLVTKLAAEAVQARGFALDRTFTGTYMTGLAMPGVSISLLVLPEDGSERNSLLALIDQPAYCPGWINKSVVADAGSTDECAKGPVVQIKPEGDPAWEKAISEAYDNVVDVESQVTHLDQLMGDGDCGQVLLSGATAIREAAQNTQLPLNDPPAALASISSIVEDAMGGTSGIIYCLFLDGLAQQLSHLNANDNGSLTPKLWGKAMLGALDTLYQYTTARPGHRTLIDALHPFAQLLAETGDLSAALDAASKGADATADMQPKRGRAVYVQQKERSADAGAVGLVAVLKGIVKSLQ